MKKYSAMTLVEILVVLVIVGILSTILLKSYTRVSEMSFRVQQTKNVHQEVLHMAQIIQNVADTMHIDYAAYSGSLPAKQGMSSVLYLQGDAGQVAFFASGACQSTGFDQPCGLYLRQGEEDIPLSDDHKVTLRNVMFKIIPYASSSEYLSGDVGCPRGDYLHCVSRPGFWLLLDAYTPNYSKTWVNAIHMPLQLFFAPLP